MERRENRALDPGAFVSQTARVTKPAPNTLIALALTLAAAGFDVALMEGGGLDFTEESQDLYLGRPLDILGELQPQMEHHSKMMDSAEGF